MASAQVTFSDGRKATIEGPDRNAIIEAVNQYEATLKPANRFEGTSEDRAAKLGIGSAVNDAVETVQRGGQFIGEKLGLRTLEQGAELEQRLSQDDEFRDELKELPGFSRGRVIGQVGIGSVIPGGVAGSLATRAATGAAGGAIAGGLTAGPGESATTNAAIGATFGAIAPFAVNAVAGIVGKIAGRRLKPVGDDGKLTDEVIELLRKNEVSPEDLNAGVARQLSRKGVLTADEAKRFNLFEEVTGEAPTRAQVTRSADDFQAQQEAAKNSGAINDRLARQDVALSDAVEGQIESVGTRAVRRGEDFEPIAVGESIQQAILKPQLDLDKQISELYNAARNSGAPGPGVEVKKLAALAKRFEGQDRISGGVTSAVRSELGARGLIDADGAVISKISVNDAEELRIAMNTLHDSASKRGKSLLKEFKDALDDDVFQFAGEDIFAQARKARRTFSVRMERAKVSKFDTSSKSIIKDLLENNLQADDVLKNISSNTTKKADLDQLVGFLKKNGGEQAISDLKAGVMRNFLERATSSNTQNSAGEAIFNGNAFAKAFKSFNGGGGKLRALFSADELRQLNKIRQVAELRIPVQGTQQGQGPSAVAIRTLGARLLERIPGADVLSGLAAQGRGIRASQRAILPQRELIEALQTSPKLRSSGAAGALASSQSRQ